MQKLKGSLTYGFDVAKRSSDPSNSDLESYDATCEKAISKGYSAMVDLTWGGWDAMENVANANGFPYIRIDASNHQFIKVRTCLLNNFCVLIQSNFLLTISP